ncbi:replication-relaxation family protein [Paenibacillus gansuensis]|uniref:Replication-relaxation family protein n=1 Tax=Paenibacillus gansuensis TaxID=306542 RepID=A0ABW5PN42_9BACL
MTLMNLSQAKVSRHMEILQSFDTLGFLTTSQVQQLHNLGGRRNTTRILSDMAEYLSSFFLDEKVYYLNAHGRKTIGSTTIRRRTIQIHHTLIRNQVYVRFRPTELWKPEHVIKWDDKQLVTDATFRLNGQYVFLEVDVTQPMAANERKIELYRELRESGRWQQKYGVFPSILYVTVSEYRQKRLRAIMGDLKAEVLTVADVK